MANPFLVKPAQYGPSMAGLGQSLASYGQQREQKELREAQQLKMQEAELEAQEAIGAMEQAYADKDYDTIAKMSIRYPQMGSAVMKAIGANEQRDQDNIVNTGFQLLSSPDSYEQIINDNPLFAEKMGGAESLINSFANNREQTLDQTENFLAHTSGDRFAQWRENTKSQEEIMTPYQQATIDTKKVDQDLRRLEIEQKRLDSQVKRETDQVKQDELKTKSEQNAIKVEEKKAEKVEGAKNAYLSSQDTLKLIDDIEKHPGFSSYVGAKGASSLFGLKDQPVAGTDAAGVATMIETLSSQNFLNSVSQMKGMGALSENEGKKLAAAVSSLDPSMREEDFKKSLNVIRNITKRGAEKSKRILEKQGVEVGGQPKASGAPSVGTVDSGYVFLGGDPSDKSNWRPQ